MDVEICLAQRCMREQLRDLWQVCFEEPSAPIERFLEKYFEPENCVVVRTGNTVIAMAHLLPAQVVAEGDLAKGHYIYAAATLPEYRSNGYMGKLLTFAAQIGEDRGDSYSFLLPSSQSLYKYYAQQGYIPYFSLRQVTMSREELQAVAGDRIAKMAFPTTAGLKALRDSQLLRHPGSVLWDERAISYAVGLNELYGGSLICTTTDEQLAYALCAWDDEENCEVVEIMAEEDTIANLSASILQRVPAQSFRFRLPGFSTLFGQKGESTHFGMIKPLGENSPLVLANGARTAYLGLTLD